MTPLTIWMPTIETGTGAQVYNRMLADGLAARGHAVYLDLVPHRWQYAPWLAPWRKPAGCDVILANSWNAATLAGKGAPMVCVVHHVVADPVLAPHKTPAQSLFHRLFVTPMERAACARAARVIAVSRTTAAAVGKYLYRGPVDVVLNGIDTGWFAPPEGPLAPCHEGRVNLLFVGKPSRRKGFPTIAALVAALGERCHLTVIGGEGEAGLPLPPGDYRGRVSRDELREAYRRADFVLLPSLVEGFGYAAAEAMACGTPVICAPHGAVAEICQPPRAALAVSEDIAGFADELCEIVAGPRHAAMRAEARALAAATLDEQRWLDGIEAVLLSAARGASA